jgi:hypothetical protein
MSWARSAAWGFPMHCCPAVDEEEDEDDENEDVPLDADGS